MRGSLARAVLVALLTLTVWPAGAGAKSGASPDCERPGKSGSDRTRDGRYEVVATSTALVASDTNAACDIYLRDRKTGKLRRISVTSDGSEARMGLVLNGEPGVLPHSIAPRFSRDGRRVRFLSAASDLVPDDTNFAWDRFVHDLKTGITRMR